MTDNTLYYGDNLDVLRRYVEDASVDLVYLDPPFNSNADYNVLFAEQDGTRSAAQVEAFGDTWKWDEAAQDVFYEITGTPGRVADAIVALHTLLGPSDMMAYLVMMAPRLEELRRVLKPTGSLYLHCDPTASHYLKILMDRTFGPENFRNEIIWKRTSGHSDARRYGRVHDVILYYVKQDAAKWNQLYQVYEQGYVDQYYRYEDSDGRRFMSGDMTASGLAGGGYVYEWKGITREWRCPIETMRRLDAENRVFYTKNGIARQKRYLDEADGMPVQDVWNDVQALRSWHRERLGYPTQKPEALLERIILASSNEQDIVLDPFCGCGTTIAAAQRLNRRWIGIDITHLAITLIKHRLRDTYGTAAEFEVQGEPVDLSGAQALADDDKYQFQWWALGLVGARPAEEKKGADKGIDGRIYFRDPPNDKKVKSVVLSVKGGNTNVAHVRDLRGVIERENAAVGVLLTMNDPTGPMKKEALTAGYYESPFWKKKYPRLQILTVEDLLAGKRIEYPPAQQTGATFKKAPKHYKKEHQDTLL